MLVTTPHGDVTELRFSSWRSRLVGYAVSAFVTRDVLVDAAFPDAAPVLGRWIDEHRLRGAILTHAHEDHSGGLPALMARGIGVQRADLTDRRLRDAERVGWYRRFTWGERRQLTQPLADFTDDAFQLRPTPGHSDDHHVVWDAERGTVFGGDLFIGVKVRIAHHDEDLRGQIAALREVASWHPERFFDAHRGRLDDPVAQLRAKADWIEETIGQIESLIQRGWVDRAIRDRVFGGEDPTGLWSFGDYSRLGFVQSVRRTMPPA
jgi:glyoxylase-like metal-dependent hydrolase (beta-lactamase superfamily II)